MWLWERVSVESMQHALCTLGPVPTLAINCLQPHLAVMKFRFYPSHVQISSVDGADLQRRLPADSY